MSDVATPTRRLGRGLSALLGGGVPAARETERTVSSELREIPASQVTRNPFQPRQQFDPEALGELASSIKEHGVLQPLIVRQVDGGFQLIAGERRWQAAQKAGLTTVPCRVVDVIDKTACEFALEENLKRKDLNDLEKAQAFREYLDHFECTLDELAKQLSMSRSAISNMLRLLELPDPIKHALHSSRISAGHARAMLSLKEAQQLELCNRIQAEHLSVRQTEATVKTLLGRDQPAAESSTAPTAAESTASETGEMAETISISESANGRTKHVESLESQLRDLLGVPVQIRLSSKDRGQIVVPFASNDEFERIVRALRRSAA